MKNPKEYAINAHAETNHTYNGLPYETHLQMVYDTAKQFSYLLPEKYLNDIYAACWCHDLIEDCRQTYNDVKSHTNENVANIVYALTNEKGKTRKERANQKYYNGIRQQYGATFVKICDRIANVNYSKQVGSRMFEMYKKEKDYFKEKLFIEKYIDIFNHLDALYETP